MINLLHFSIKAEVHMIIKNGKIKPGKIEQNQKQINK